MRHARFWVVWLGARRQSAAAPLKIPVGKGRAGSRVGRNTGRGVSAGGLSAGGTSTGGAMQGGTTGSAGAAQCPDPPAGRPALRSLPSNTTNAARLGMGIPCQQLVLTLCHVGRRITATTTPPAKATLLASQPVPHNEIEGVRTSRASP